MVVDNILEKLTTFFFSVGVEAAVPFPKVWTAGFYSPKEQGSEILVKCFYLLLVIALSSLFEGL
jgi:hypothetical protein